MDNIDDSYIWQRRIHHGIRDQKGPVPFPSSVEIGLEFNAAFERKEKLDLCLLTNGVMLDLCDFARTVTRSEKFFLFEVLEFNFDLGLDTDNDMLCYDYASRVHIKIKQVKEQIKLKPQKYKEIFTLPNPYSITGKYYPRYLKRNKTDSSVSTDGNKSIQISQMTENHGVANSKLSIRKKGGVLLKQTADYPFCRQLGVTLAVQSGETSKQKLDPKLLTNGVMLELLDFSRGLCGTQTQIIYALVKQNFGHVLDKLRFRLQLQKVIETKNSCPTAEDKETYRKEPFQVQSGRQDQRCRKRPNPDTDYQQVDTEISAAKRRQSDARELDQDSDLSYMCPIDFETEMLAGASVGPEKVHLESSLSGTAAETEPFVPLDVKKEEEEDVVSPVQPQTNGLHCHLVRSHSENDAISRLFSEDKAQNINGQTHKQKLWMRRSIRSKQILKSRRINDLFAQCRKIGLDFNVSSGNKQNLDLQLLTNQVLVEVLRFAAAMRRTITFFLFDIMEKNFNLPHQDEHRCRNLIYHINSKTKFLQNHPAIRRTEFLNRPFPFPEVYKLTKVTCRFETEKEQQIIWDTPFNWQTEECYPFCKKLGVNLWLTEKLPATQKLHLTDLTTGAMMEIMSFIQELRGTVYSTVNDILHHNFDLDLQGESTRALREIQKWYFKQKRLLNKHKGTPQMSTWLNMVVTFNGRSHRPPTSNKPKDPDSEVSAPSAGSGKVPLMKKENSFHICREIGLDLDVGSKSEAKTKLDLRLLTRGVLLELHQYVEQNCKYYVPTLYEILEYNFDLSSQSHRKVELAWSIAAQVIAMASKNGRKGDYLKTVFELPMEPSEVACKQEPEDDVCPPDTNRDDGDDVMFVRQLKPIDIEVEVE